MSQTLSLPKLKSNWRGLAQTGVWIIGIVSIFVFTPPAEIGSDSAGTFRSFSAFALAVLMGIMSVPLSKLKSKNAALGWAAVAIFLLGLGVGLFFWYQSYRSNWSAKYGGSRVVIGDELTHDGSIYMDKDRPASNEQAVLDAGGIPTRIWTTTSIHSKAQTLYRIYFCVIIVLSMTVVTAIQTRYCALQEHEKRKARTTKPKVPGEPKNINKPFTLGKASRE